MNKNRNKRILSFVLALIWCVSLFSFESIDTYALTPSYEVSSQYKSSSYYSALCNVKLTGNQRTDIINVARSQVGYREGNCLDDLNGYNTGKHSYNNYCEYNYFYYGKSIAGGSSYPWCAVFVTWCARQAGVSSSIIKSSACAGCEPQYFNLSYKSGSQYTPQVGDLFFTSSWSHVGLVSGVNGDSFTTIEGNTNNNGSSEGNGVYERTRYGLNNYYFASPNYVGCTHTYSNGHCTKCGALQPLQNDNTPCTVGIYTANTTVYLRSDPYETGVQSTNNCKLVLNKGTEVTVEGAVTNGIGYLWYKVCYGNESGYIFAQNLTYKSAVTGTISVSSLSIPTNLKAGNGFHISGTISTENCSVTKARAYFCYASNNQMVANSATSWYTYNTKSLSLLNSDLDSYLKFEQLPAGNYYYCIEVQTDKEANGKTTNVFASKTFSIGAMVVPAPSIWESSSGIGSKTFSISGTGTVRYRINGGSWVSGTSVTVDHSCYIEAQCISDNTTSAITAISVNLPVLQEPAIQSVMNESGATVTISSDNGATIYYSLNGGSYQQYYGAFPIAKTSSVSAYSQKNGCITSNTATVSVKVSAPSIPTVARDTAADIAMGRAVTVHWNLDALASSYQITVTKDGKSWKTDIVTGTQYSFTADTAGSYEVSAVAINAIGKSAVSNIVKATAHAPLKVTFEDYDGTALSVQTVPYAEAATKPVSPSRRGYTFSGWSTAFSEVTADTIVKAEYEINVYSVKFYDVNGATLLATQEIAFNQPINSAAVEKLVTVENGGYVFSGWYISNAAEDSERDLTHIDSDMKLTAVTAWGNEDLPVYVSDLSATVCYDKNNKVFNGYSVRCNVSTSDKRDINAKLIVTLLAEVDDGSGTLQMINTKVDPIILTAGANSVSWQGDVLCDGTANADWVEVSVVSVDGYDRTGGLISETKRIPIISEATRLWSEWMSEAELNSAGHTINDSGIESKMQYSDRTNTKTTTTTSSATAPSGYTLESDDSYWKNWSEWSDTAVASSDAREVETKQVSVSQGYTQYRYGSWYNGSRSHFCGASISSPWLRYTDWSTMRYTQDQSDTYNYCGNYSHYTNGKHIGYKSFNGTTFYWARWTIGGKNYYWEESQWVDTSYNKTQYRYRDHVGSYTYCKWDYGQWSDWKDSELVDSDPSNPDYEVQTKTLYRYAVFDAGTLPGDNSGTTQTVSGKLDFADGALDNKHATIFVYKSLNSDPTESQLEYVGQTVLGKDGSYSFTFRTKETVSEETGDFVVALSAEGSNGLINVGLVKYERPSYTVTFTADDRTLCTQKVVKGESAIAPEVPAKEGYEFIGWSKGLTNITQNTTVVAQYKPIDCSIVFVDYLNQRSVIAHYDYGSVFTVPAEMESPSYEGYDFMGWSYGNDASVSGNRIVSAIWKEKTYKVNFYDADDQIISSQTVAHGQAATPPETIAVDDNRMFLAWSNESNWWDVRSDVNVYPVVVYKETTAEPSSGLEEYTDALYARLELVSNQDATIYYTLDGSNPDPDHVISATSSYSGDNGITKVYAGTLELFEDAYIKAMAVSPERNDSDISVFVFHYTEEADGNSLANESELLAEQEVTVDAFDTVQVSVDLSTNPMLSDFSFYVNADPAVFCVDFDRQTHKPMVEAGSLCADGSGITIGEYQEGVGWRIDWAGEPSTVDEGTLLSVMLISDSDTDGVTTPVSVSWIPENMLSSENEKVHLKGLETVHIIASPHVHSYLENVTNATCTVKGKRECTCSVCGDTYIEEIPTLGHNWVADQAVAATCTTAGLTAGEHCTRCNYATYEIVPALGHDFVDGSCTRCGEKDSSYVADYAVITVDNAYAMPGQTITLPVFIEENKGFAGFTFTIAADEGLELTKISKAGILLQSESGAMTPNVAKSQVNWTDYCNEVGDGELLFLTFAIDENIAGGDYRVQIALKDDRPINFVNEEDKVVPVRFVDGTITVSSFVYGDLNGDGDISSGDSVKLARYLVDMEEFSDQQLAAADVNHDGEVTAGDAVMLAKYLVGLIDTLEKSTSSMRGMSTDVPALEGTSIDVGAVTGQKGDVVSVPVSIHGNSGFAGFTFEILHDSDIRLREIKKGTLLKESDSGTFTENVSKNLVNWTDSMNLCGDGSLMELTFELKKSGSYEIGLATKEQRASNFVNADAAVIAAQLPDGDVIARFNCFTDLPNADSWAYAGIDYCVRKGMMRGVSNEMFNPAGVVTRAQLVTLLYRVAGESDAAYEGVFTDVAAGEWYTEAVEWAYRNGIVNGLGNGKFVPNAPITREQIAAILYRYSGSPKAESNLGAFSDSDTVSLYAVDAMKWSVSEGLINGLKSDETIRLSPKTTATRAQIAAIIMRFLKNN